MQKLRGFTLIELAIASTIFSIIIVGIVFAVSRAYTYVQVSKLQLISMNLAREGMEAVYNIRDTNWRRYSWAKDVYWIKSNPYNTGVRNTFAWEGLYYLNSTTNSGFVLIATGSVSDINKHYTDTFFDNVSSASSFKMTFGWNLSIGSWSETLQNLMDKEAQFFRIVRVFGVYDKRAAGSNAPNQRLSCPSAIPSNLVGISSNNCFNDYPKELRFCVKVFYISPNSIKGSSELCGMLTNFLE